ncbi:MAG TPA: cytochrome o ubiquinol oxidase subunit III [Candidatus Saccharimonadales bacterium]|nr:cytochrome o ubiquinol oxidase subunit III [Candidatus Saccharimonadales bacterium]
MKEEVNDRTFFGFWVYLMTDLLMFGGLFAAFAVLRTNSFGGVTEKDIYNLPYVLLESVLLLTSSFTAGLAILSSTKGNVKAVIGLLFATFLLGVSFLGMELYEFSNLFKEGHTFQKSAFLSSYFTLVGTHGVHILVGLIWMIILFIYILKRGLTKSALRKLTLFSLFWHFLDIVWIFIFTIVYLMGVSL